MASMAIETRGLVKHYGHVRALDGIDLAVPRGEVFGFLGPNGAGKTTTIRILLDLLRPTAGTVRVLGTDPAKDAGLRLRVGYLPGELRLPARRTAGELLRYLTRLRGGAGADQLEVLAERFELDLTRPIRALSKGNKQKIGVIQAFMHLPDLLILDEPTSGLDPLLQRQFLDLVREHTGRGASVFMSSHVLREVEDIASQVAILRDGQLVDVSSVSVLRRRAGQRVLLRFDTQVAPGDFEHLPHVERLEVSGHEVRCTLTGSPDALLKAAAAHRVVRWHAQDRELEDLFLDFYRQPAGTKPPDDGAHRPRTGRRGRRAAR